MANQNLFSGKIVVVAKSDTADYRTIVEAIENVEPETRILVQPGVYRESIVINKPLEIIGYGRVSDIVIESIDASCILMQTESSLVRGLTLRNANQEQEHKYCAVNISQGKLILEDCNITSDSSSCIAIAGSLTDPEIRRCCIYDSKAHGISIRNNGLGTIEDCDIYGNADPGVYIDNGGNPQINRCRIYDGKSIGICIQENGLGIIEDCDIYRNTYPGVYIDNGSNPQISRCYIYDGKSIGIYIKKNGLGTIEDCDIYCNSYSEISIEQGSKPKIHQCRIYNGKGMGISITDKGKGLIENCAIYGNFDQGIYIEQGSNPLINQCRICDNKQSGISITDKGKGLIEDCAIYGNSDQGIYIDKGSSPLINQCRIYDNKQSGISIKDHGLGIIEDCDIYRNIGVGVVISDKSNPTFRRCQIHHGKQQAISIKKLGQGIIQNCKIESHPIPGIRIAQQCQPTFRRCTLKTIKPPYLGLAFILGISIAFPIAFPSLAFASKLGILILLTAIALVYFQFSRKGFRKRFAISIISMTVFFGIMLADIYISGLNSVSVWFLMTMGCLLQVFILAPVFEQANLISNYDIKKLSSKKQ